MNFSQFFVCFNCKEIKFAKFVKQICAYLRLE